MSSVSGLKKVNICGKVSREEKVKKPMNFFKIMAKFRRYTNIYPRNNRQR